jgi:hypothetical protein
MISSILWPASALLMTLALAGSAVAQPPGRGGPPGGPFGRGGPGGPLQRALDELPLSAASRETAREAVRAYQENGRTVTNLAFAEFLLKMKDVLGPEDYKKFREATDGLRRGPGAGRLTEADIVERLMSFDKNKDGKLTKDELPERIQDLIAKGDTNKDGALDREEVKKLAAEQARAPAPRADGPFGRGGPGGRGGAPPGPPVAAVERAVGDLKLSGVTKEKAQAAVKAYQDKIREVTELARADLLLTMTDLLNEEEFKKFKAVVDRQPGFGRRPPNLPLGPFRPGDR